MRRTALSALLTLLLAAGCAAKAPAPQVKLTIPPHCIRDVRPQGCEVDKDGKPRNCRFQMEVVCTEVKKPR